MNTKLTLRLDNRLITSAKRHSAESGRSLSQLVADFFALIETEAGLVEATPRVRSLRGVLAGSGLDESDYARHLEEKYL
ncbi:MAG: antitoxin [Armatimonadetes bacterium]|nr:antitoxin [Armatimonadota bacterium]